MTSREDVRSGRSLPGEDNHLQAHYNRQRERSLQDRKRSKFQNHRSTRPQPIQQLPPQQPSLPIPPPPQYPPPHLHRSSQQHRIHHKRRRSSRSFSPYRRSNSHHDRHRESRRHRRRDHWDSYTPSPDGSVDEGQRRPRRQRTRSPLSARRRGKSGSYSRPMDKDERRRGGRRSRNRSMDSSLSSIPDRRTTRRTRRRRQPARRRHSSSHGASPPSEPRHALANNVSPRAGVVSDDDDGARHQHTRQGNSLPPPPPKARDPAADRSTRTANKHSSHSSSHDDTIGHFKGRQGTIVADQYRIEREVGVGTFGRVLECLDLKRFSRSGRRDRQNSIVAIKIVRNVKRYYESALIEADIVDDVNRRGGRGVSHCAVMYDAFTFSGHYCMVFERLGPSLYDFQKRQKYQPFPLMCVRDFAKQLLETLEFLHSFRLIHTDLKPENILLVNGREVNYKGQCIPESTRIKVIDFGGATYDNEKKSSVVNTRQYRAPEVILGVGWSMPSDLWSIGCILAELYQGELLFATHDNVEHLALIEQVVGPFPRRMLKRSKNTELVNEAFDTMGAHRMERILPPESLAYVKRIGSLESLTKDADSWFLRLLRRILVTDPDERATAKECLRKL